MKKRTNKIRKPYRGAAVIAAATVDAAQAKAVRAELAIVTVSRAETSTDAPVVPIIADAEMARLQVAMPGRHAALIRKAHSAVMRGEMLDRWSHKQGTPETHDKINSVSERRRQSPLARMAAAGTITRDELRASEEILQVMEMIERTVGVRSASMEARVDCDGSGRDALIESLGRIRLEVAYRAWRQAIPEPRPMILAMISSNVAYVKLAGIYGLHWRTARKRLISALRLWPTMKLEARRMVDDGAVNEVYARLGEGVLLEPKSKTDQPTIAEDNAR